MNRNGVPIAIDTVVYDRNRQQLPAAELERCAGQWVAISGDGTRILAAADSVEDLTRELKARGIDQAAVVWERLPAADEGWL
jgi:hypothetical protein